MGKREQGPNESLEEYVRAKQRLCVRCGISVQRTKHHTLLTLNNKNEDLVSVMNMKEHATIDDLLEGMLEFQAVRTQRQMRKEGNGRSSLVPRQGDGRSPDRQGSSSFTP